jgi:hypothetical protein
MIPRVKNISFLIICIVLLYGPINIYAKGKLHKVKINFTTTESYCGGAAPSPEILQNLETKIPLPNTVFYIIKGNINKNGIAKIKKIVTDSNGSCFVKLPFGNYSIISVQQAQVFKIPENTRDYKWDIACLKSNWSRPLLSFNAKPNFVGHINLHKNCFHSLPCGQYSGQYPP